MAILHLPRLRRSARQTETQIEREKMKALESAEAHVGDLRRRADEAIRTLDERRAHDRWQETIEQMIRGVA